MPGVEKTMQEYKAGKLHSGSKKGPVVRSRAQAIAIGLSEARKAGEHVAPAPHRNGVGAAGNHDYGHSAPQRHGHLRMSGHSGGHRIGKGK